MKKPIAKLYTAPHCPKCEVAVAHQQKIGIPFEKITDTNLAITKGFKTVPMLEIQNESSEYVVAYNLQGILNLRGDNNE